MANSFAHPLYHLIAGGLAVFVFSLLATGCMASTPVSGANAVQGRHTSSAKVVANADVSRQESQSDSELPPYWPWRGVTMVYTGASGPQPSDIDEFVNQFGINSVHLYPHLLKFGPSQGLSDSQAWSQAMQWLDVMIAECRKDHVIAIVHLRSFPKPGGGYYNQHLASFWNNPAAVNEIYTQVAALVKHLDSYGNDLVAFDIISEPVMKTSFGVESPPGWDGIQKRIIQTIRANDPGRWVVVKPGPWGGAIGYGDFSPLPFPRLVYSVHIYAPNAYTHQGIHGNPVGVHYPGKIGRRYWDKQMLETVLSPAINFQNRYNVLVWVGEFSAVRWAPGSDQYLRDLVSIFDSHGWGWSYFSVGGWNGWDPRYDASYTSGSRADMTGAKSPRWQTLHTLFGEGGN
ncbi:MAG: glycoside hydrolase family 5 protein [Gammaproteobacteria bacterium]